MDLLRQLLDLDTLRLGEEGVRLGFARAMPAYLWVGAVVACLALGLWSYVRLIGPAWARGLLGGMRALLLALLLVLVMGPQLVRRDERIERDWVLVLADRSASMQIADAPTEAGGRTTREEQLRSAIGEAWPAFERMSEQREVVWLGFDAGAFTLDREDAEQPPASETAEERANAESAPLALGEPGGRRTNLGAALEHALRRAAARPLSGVVVLSDGRSGDEPSRSALRALQADRAPVHVVPLGSAEPVGDVAIARIDAPDAAFVEDLTPIRVRVERLGAGDGGAVARLVDERTGITLDEQRIEAGALDEAGGASVTLTHRASDPGERAWRVEIEAEGADLIAGNNAGVFGIELIDRPLRVLYIDGYPRWEQRYLKNLLLREDSIDSTNLILTPDRAPSQESDTEIASLPDSPERWAEYDVVILGDVQADVFTTAQLEDLREHVATRGGGLLWIGGEGATPESWWATPLADLLPFSRGQASAASEPALVRPEPLAEQLGVLLLGGLDSTWPAELASAQTGWSLLRWRQIVDPAGLKPTAETIASAAPLGGGDRPDLEARTPLVMSMRYGAGRALYVATDEIWRWRYGRGELLFERFWLQLVRLLGRDSVSRSGVAASLAAEPSRATIDQPVRIALELLDQSLVELGLGRAEVTIEREDAGLEEGRTELTLRAEDEEGRFFATTWLPTRAGTYLVRTTAPSLAGLGLETQVEVSLADDELRRPETDHELLARLSERTGGQVLTPATLASVESILPNRRVRSVTETSEALWDTPLALLAVLVLLTGEWVGRRLIRLI